MKLVSFWVSTPFGARTRIGAVDETGRFVDLAAAYRHALRARGATAEAADRMGTALLPSDMVAFIEGAEPEMAAAREAIAWAAGQAGDEVDGVRVRWDPAAVTLLSPVPRPAFLRDFMAVETHVKNIYPRLGREIPAGRHAYREPGAVSVLQLADVELAARRRQRRVHGERVGAAVDQGAVAGGGQGRTTSRPR